MRESAGRLWCLRNINTAGWNNFSLSKDRSVGISLFCLSPYENRLLNAKHLQTHLQFNADKQSDTDHLKSQVFSLNMQGEIIACCMVITRDIKHFPH